MQNHTLFSKLVFVFFTAFLISLNLLNVRWTQVFRNNVTWHQQRPQASRKHLQLRGLEFCIKIHQYITTCGQWRFPPIFCQTQLEALISKKFVMTQDEWVSSRSAAPIFHPSLNGKKHPRLQLITFRFSHMLVYPCISMCVYLWRGLCDLCRPLQNNAVLKLPSCLFLQPLPCYPTFILSFHRRSCWKFSTAAAIKHLTADFY